MEKQKSNILCKCSEVTLEIFIDCLVNENYRRLLREGEATGEELVEAWELLYSDYVRLSGSKSQASVLTLIKSVELLNAKITAVGMALSLPDGVEWAKKYGYKGGPKKNEAGQVEA